MASLLARTVAFTGHRPRYFSFSGGNDPHLLALRRTLREQILRLHRETLFLFRLQYRWLHLPICFAV